MKYCYVDFFPWEKDIVISQLEKEGKHVYSVIDAGGKKFEIGKGLIVNRYAYMVTDEPLPLGERRTITDREFYDLKPVEDNSIKYTTVDLSDQIADAKKRYNEELR